MSNPSPNPPPVPDCRFCRDNGLLSDAPIAAGPAFYLLHSRDPDLRAAVMIIPNRHVATPFDLPPEDWTQMPQALDAARAALAPYAPDGYTMGWNVGPVAGQTVFHLHLHVIARFADGPHAGRGLRIPFKAPDGSWS